MPCWMPNPSRVVWLVSRAPCGRGAGNAGVSTRPKVSLRPFRGAPSRRRPAERMVDGGGEGPRETALSGKVGCRFGLNSGIPRCGGALWDPHSEVHPVSTDGSGKQSIPHFSRGWSAARGGTGIRSGPMGIEGTRHGHSQDISGARRGSLAHRIDRRRRLLPVQRHLHQRLLRAGGLRDEALRARCVRREQPELSERSVRDPVPAVLDLVGVPIRQRDRVGVQRPRRRFIRPVSLHGLRLHDAGACSD